MEISHNRLTIKVIANAIKSNKKLSLSQEAKSAIVKCREYLDGKIKETGAKFYGVNTGFGSLCDVEISQENIEELQTNLVKSHACGVGNEVPAEIVKLMLLLKIQSLCYGHSGVALATVERLIDFYNYDILPVVYDTGSLGASGDLAPLAHLALPMIGLGEVYVNREKISSEKMLKKFGWKKLKLQSKEGLALLNGTQMMSAYGIYMLINSQQLFEKMNMTACVSLEAFDCRSEPFDELVHKVRGHKGQIYVAKFIKEVLKDSKIAATEKKQVQDPYSFRCIPQVHGASEDILHHVQHIFETEINGVTDNPNIFPDEDKIISAGNFHGQPLAMALDYLKLSLAEMGSISERRVFLMLSGTRNLPTYLTPFAGLHSGLMIAQYTAAALVSKNKQLCTPASVDSITSSNGQEDHVSMGASAATQCLQILENLKDIAAIELFVATQALSYRSEKSSPKIEGLVENYREKVKKVEEDRVLATDVLATKIFMDNWVL